MTLVQTTTVKAVSCSSSNEASQAAKFLFVVEPGPIVKVSFRLEGEVSPADLSAELKDAFRVSFASAIGIQAVRVTDFEVKDARRRLLAVDITLSIAASSASEADAVAANVAKADLSGVAGAAGLEGTTIGEVFVSVEDPSGQASVSPEPFPVAVVAASVVGGLFALSLCAAGVFYVSRIRAADSILLKLKQGQDADGHDNGDKYGDTNDDSNGQSNGNGAQLVDADLVGDNVSSSTPALFPADRQTPLGLESRFVRVSANCVIFCVYICMTNATFVWSSGL